MKSFVFMLFMLCGSVAAQSQSVLVRQGEYSYGKVLYNWDGKYLRQGAYSYGKVICNWDGKFIRQGEYSYGKVFM